MHKARGFIVAPNCRDRHKLGEKKKANSSLAAPAVLLAR
jgi:hypothetical protein